MAHPVRLRLLNSLVIHGPATATELAERIDDTPANCSWHLRQLAKYGLIEEAADLPAKGRNRPWRWVPRGTSYGTPDDSPEMAIAARETAAAMFGFELAERNAWEETKSLEPRQWQEAPFGSTSIAWLTVAELTEMNEAIQELYLRYIDRIADPAKRPPDARPIRLVAWGVPAK
jgi:predicted ArsR family transcriptional regulator